MQNKIKEAQYILTEIGMPPAQCNEISALTLLALSSISPTDNWSSATNKSLGVSKGIMTFVNDVYEKNYAANTRETFRRQVLHQFEQARLVNYNPDNPNLPVNSPRAHYALTPEFLKVIQSYETEDWNKSKKEFIKNVGKLSDTYLKERELLQIPVTLPNGKKFMLSPGKHNEVQAAIIQEFAPRFAPGSIVLYLGDTAQKNLHIETEILEKLGIPITQHSKLPDVVIYDESKEWLFLIEAVTSHGPVSPKRIVELEEFLKDCKVGKVYVTAFPNMSEFKKHSNDIAWETEVWLMDIPDHMIHFNGDRFMGPRDTE